MASANNGATDNYTIFSMSEVIGIVFVVIRLFKKDSSKFLVIFLEKTGWVANTITFFAPSAFNN